MTGLFYGPLSFLLSIRTWLIGWTVWMLYRLRHGPLKKGNRKQDESSVALVSGTTSKLRNRVSPMAVDLE